MEIEKYKKIISQNDSNLICSFLEALFGAYDNNDKISFDALTALSFSGFVEATYRLLTVYLIKLKLYYEKDEKNEKIEEILKTKIFDLFLILEKKKYYKAYAEYGLFLYNEMRSFDKALQIFKEGYENNQYECAYYYFLSFIKSNNQLIYEKNNFNSKDFINIFQTLIDGFIYGNYEIITNMFDFLYIIGKKYNLLSELNNKYINCINEIAELCLSFVDNKKDEENIKKLFPINNENLKFCSYYALSMIYMYGVSTKVKKNLIKAQDCLTKIIKYNEKSEPYYTRYILKINKIFYKLGIFKDENEIILIIICLENYMRKV